MLDEPDNHLDLASIEALEQMLGQYRGTLVLVSHDEELLQRLQLTHRLEATDKGWRSVKVVRQLGETSCAPLRSTL